MGLFKFFHVTKTCEEDMQREKDCISRIKYAVGQKCGIDEFIDYDDFTVLVAYIVVIVKAHRLQKEVISKNA